LCIARNRCVGWAQCSKCSRPDRAVQVPPGAENSRCAPHPVQSCPVAGAHCPPPVTCCSTTTSCPSSEDCPELLPTRCSAMPAINCSPNVPASGWSVLGWKPSPAAFRSNPSAQTPSSSCRGGKPAVAEYTGRRCCECRYLEATPRPLTLHYVADRAPLSPCQPFPCNAPPDVSDYTCSRLSGRKLVERVNFKYTFPGMS